jgi:hypothetical protein
MSQALPTPGGDVGTWGYMLNGFLEVSLNSDGTLNTTAVGSALPTPISTANLGTGTASSSNFLRGDGTWAVPPTASNATASSTGLVQLAGDLGGSGTTATAPTLAATTNVESIISANATVTSKAPIANPTFTGKVTTPALQVTTGAGTANQVLTSDTSGNATWGSLSVSGSYVPLAGSAFVLFGHSLAASGGVTGNYTTRGWHSLLAAMTRGHIWDQAVGGAVLAKAALTRTTTGFGGITQVLQGLVPNPDTGINWRGTYSGSVYYAPNDGVYSSGNWYRCESNTGQTGIAPPGGAWIQVTAGGAVSLTGEAAMPTYLPIQRIPIIWFGNNDVGMVYQGNDQPFLSAMETSLARACASAYYDAGSTMVAYAGGTFTNVPNNYVGAGTSIEVIPNTPGATITFITPSDWPGGYVDFQFGLAQAPEGTMAFTVDGTNTNVLNSGTSSSNVANFSSPFRNHVDLTSLTTALTSGVAVTSLAVLATPDGINSGDTIVVGQPGSTDTFTATSTLAAGVTSIPVTSHAPTNNHAIGDSVYDSASESYEWSSLAVIVVRIPTTAGQHTVVGTVTSGATMANTYFNGVALESPNPPPIIVGSLAYLENYQIYWNSRLVNDALIDTWNTALQSLVAQFSTAHYVDATTVLRPGARLTTGLTASQSGITSLAVAALPYAIASGDEIMIGSGLTQQQVVASGAAAIGATSIPVTSFTSTYAQGVGTWVYDSTVTGPSFYLDGVHPSDYGHSLVAQLVLQAVEAATSSMSMAQLARFSTPIGEQKIVQRYQGTAPTVGTGTANAWARVGTVMLTLPADPGDVIEIDYDWLLNPVSGLESWMDLATWNPFPSTPINYLSGSTFAGNAGSSGLGGDSVGAKATNGFTPWQRQAQSATDYVPHTGRVWYVVQPADIINGFVNFVLYGATASTTTTTILTASPNMMLWSATNTGPMSFNAEAA